VTAFVTIEGANQLSADVEAGHPAEIECVHARLGRFASASFSRRNRRGGDLAQLASLPGRCPPSARTVFQAKTTSTLAFFTRCRDDNGVFLAGEPRQENE
jgi:hypothetical protein